jgi:4-amino-4-deoxy-L-arabinose transferase-like glycosyltransferase
MIVGSLLAAHAALLGWSAWRHSPTVDEVGHLPAGISHWYFGRFELYRVNPPLVGMVGAAPVVCQRPETPWFTAYLAPGARSEFSIGREFIAANGRRSFWLFTSARWACIPFSILGAYVCLRWGRELYGHAAGLTAMMLWCFSPNILAHGSLMTPDVAAAALGAAAGYTFWRWLESPTWTRAFIAALVLGVALLTKFTLMVFLPLWPVIWPIWRWPERHDLVRARWLRESSQIAVMLLLALYTINVGYAFEGSFQRLGSYEFVSRLMVAPGGEPEASRQATGNRFAGTWLGAMPVPLPRNCLMGIDPQRRDFEAKIWSYLRGEWREGGWWYYYLYALAIKVPLGTWVLLVLALLASLLARGYAASWRHEVLLLAPLATLLVLVSSQTGVQYLRYALPMFPFAFVWTSKVARAVELEHWKLATLVAVALAWSVGSSLRVYPHSLSYFNELVGGPKNGHAHLLDSNIDWGQDLLYLKRWYDAHPEARPLGLAFFGFYDPAVAGIQWAPPPAGPTGERQVGRLKRDQLGPLPGWYALSVNAIHRRTREYEYFLRFEPVAMVGYSIYIYHITLDEATRVRRELGLPELQEPDGKLK